MVRGRVAWAWGRWRGGTPTGGGPGRAGVGVARASLGVGGRRRGFGACLGPGVSDGWRLGPGGQPRVAKGEGSGAAPPPGPLRRLGLLGAGAHRVALRAPWAVAGAQPLATERTALGGSGLDCGAVQAEVAPGQPPHFWGVQEAVHQEVLQCWHRGGADVGQGGMLRREAARPAVERHRRGGRPGTRAGPEGAWSVAIKPQTSQPFRGDGLATAWTLGGVERTESQGREHVDDAACHRGRRQTCTQRDGGRAGGFVSGVFAFSAHVPRVRCISAYGQRVLSDRLLALWLGGKDALDSNLFVTLPLLKA